MTDIGSETRGTEAPPAWFDRVGARGFATAGAMTGLALALAVILYLAPSPVAPARVIADPRPLPSSAAATTPVTATASPDHPGATRTAPSPLAAPAEAEPPPPRSPTLSTLTSTGLANGSETVDSPTVDSPAQRNAYLRPSDSGTAGPKSVTTGAASSSLASEICGYLTLSGPCQNRAAGGGYCHLHQAPSYTPPSYSGGGTVHVRGYYRKDGTYVRPHTRSAPRRR
jgi:hypothetical protein